MKKRIMLFILFLLCGFLFAENYIYFDTHKWSPSRTVELYSRIFFSKSLLSEYDSRSDMKEEFYDYVQEQLTEYISKTSVIRYVTRIHLENTVYTIWFIWYNEHGYGNVSVQFGDIDSFDRLGWQTIFYTGDYVWDFETCYNIYLEKCNKYIKML